MSIISAGLLMYRFKDKILDVVLVHLGGPVFKKHAIWVIPNGRAEKDEDLIICAKREFNEETGIVIDEEKKFLELGSVTYNTKQLFAWAFEDGTFDPKNLKSNLTKFGWPEVDKGDYFSLTEAAKIIYPGQKVFLDRLQTALGLVQEAKSRSRLLRLASNRT